MSAEDLAHARLLRLARAAGPANSQFVYIGATVLPLVANVDLRFEAPRLTDDVDAVCAAASYTRRGQIEEQLRSRGFRHDVTSRHAGRWIAPDETLFDLAFAGDQLGATGSIVDAMAIQLTVERDGDPMIRHVSGAGLLLMKVAAFRDRGRAAPSNSKDLADLAVLLVGRPALATECTHHARPVVEALAASARLLLDVRELDEALRRHFADRTPILPDTAPGLAVEARAVLEQIAAR